MDIDIPQVFVIYNDYKLFGNKFAFKREFDKPEIKPEGCVVCGNCINACPQHLEIPQFMEEIQEEYKKLG